MMVQVVQTAKVTASRLKTYAGGTDLDGAVVINESSADVDFRVESNGNANMFGTRWWG